MLSRNQTYLFLVLMLTILVVTTLPFLILSLSCVPVIDDFVYAAKSDDFGVVGAVIMWYFSFTGRYTSSLILSILPIQEADSLCAQVVPALLIIGFIGSLYYCILSFRVLSRLQAFSLSTLIFSVYISTLSSPGEMFYWLSGSITYTLPIIIMLLLWGFIVQIWISNELISKSCYFLIILSCVMLCGSNEVMIFYHGFLSFLFLFVAIKQKSVYRNLAILIFTITVGCSLVSLLAPGNFERQSYIKKVSHVSHSFEHSIHYTIRVVGIWFYLRTKRFAFLFLILAIPFILFIDSRPFNKFHQLRPHPLYLISAIFAGHLFTYLPVTLSLSEYYPDRTLDFIYFTYIIAVVAAIIYTSIYYKLNFIVSKKLKKAINYVLLLLGCFALLFDKKTNTALAYNSVINRTDVIYKKEHDLRLLILSKNQRKKLVKLAPISVDPKPLKFTDIDKTPHSNSNIGYETYFHIDSVIMLEKNKP